MLSPQHKRQTAFIVAVTVKVEVRGEAEAATYAAMRPSAEQVLASVQVVVDVEDPGLIAGKLSARMA